MTESEKRRRLRNIKLFATDCDGCLTDGKLYIGENGEQFKVFSVKDGQGIRLLQSHNIVPAIITTRTSAILARRAKELDIQELHQKVRRKETVLAALAEQYNIDLKQIAYLGDDLNDLRAIQMAGISFAPADCARQIRSEVDIVLRTAGGDGALREAVEMIVDMIENGYENIQDSDFGRN